jgi:hypothetical protein
VTARSRRWRSARTAAAAALLAGVGCGGGEPTRTLTAADVANQPSGSATGSEFSGDYLVVSSNLTGCSCRVGSCATLQGKVGALLTFAQQDGVLTVTDQDGNAAAGGIDANGTFWYGGAGQSTTATAYSIAHGHIAVVAGAPDTADEDLETTIATSSGATTPLDCDLRVQVGLRFEGP